MRAVLPGKPTPGLQALATGFWESRQFDVYITGNGFAILNDPESLLQTVYDDDESELLAIAFDEVSGKIATCTQATVRIYKPFGHNEDALKWGLQTSFPIPGDSINAGYAPCLSWGATEELLLSTSTLRLYQTSSSAECFWERHLPNQAKVASLSFDSAYVANIGHYDNIVKVWRRLNYGADEVRFDLACLPHPNVVTNIRWRKPYHVEQTIENVLYTTCLDMAVRVWVSSDNHTGQPLYLGGKIDISWSIQQQTLAHPVSTGPWVFFVDGREITAAAEKAIQQLSSTGQERNAALERLVSVANKNPELCFVYGGGDALSTLALENIGSRSLPMSVTSIAHVELKDPTLRSGPAHTGGGHVEIQAYCARRSGQLRMLVHEFHGKIRILETDLVELINPGVTQHSLDLRCIWSGHSAPIQKIVRNFSGRAVVSRTAGGESIVWNHSGNTRASSILSRQSVIPDLGHIHRICVLRKGRFVVFLTHDAISLWDCRSPQARLLDRQLYNTKGRPLCLLILPRNNLAEYQVAHIASVSSEQDGIVWEIKLPPYTRQGVTTQANGHVAASIRQFCTFDLDDADGLAYVLPVDPAGAAPVTTGFLDVFAKDVAVSYTHSGRVNFWTARIEPVAQNVQWLSTCSAETGLEAPALVSGSTLKKAALVDSSRSQLYIWDIGGARLEYNQSYGAHHIIRDLDWTSTPDSQSILAVGFQSRVVLLSQMRFDYLNKGPAWAPIREISIRELTPHPIGDSTWLGDGHLVIGAGNQLFVEGRQFGLADSRISSLMLPHKKEGAWDLFEAVQRFNGPLPVFHPQFLSQNILSGKTMTVQKILLALHQTLKYHVQGETVDDYLGLDVEEFYMPEAQPAQQSDQQGSFVQGEYQAADSEEIFSESVTSAINERLTKVGLSQLSGHEQIQLADIVECVGLVEKHRRSLDENGARFMLFFRQHALRKGRTNEINMSWREILWAFHSTSQDILVDFVTRQYHGSLLWVHARESGMFMWLDDPNALRSQFELIARNEYTKSDDKNPIDCSIYYLALKKKTVLQGLWRMASWHREQGATQRLLANNFEDPKWRTTALKNAYALLSKRRFEYAAAFFLLADHLQDAVNVCLNQLKDLQLAVAVTRVYEGENGPVLRKLLEEEVLGVAAREGNRWLASWAFWMLNRKDMAVRALITPVYTLLETPLVPDMASKSFLTDDPALVVLYAQLREKTLQTLRGASKITPRVEWEFVLHSAKLYDRMGCDLLGLDLVRNWEFPPSGLGLMPGFGGEVNPLKLLRRRSSLVVADLPMSGLHMDVRSASGGKPAPTVFQEPEASSLLDSFGF